MENAKIYTIRLNQLIAPPHKIGTALGNKIGNSGVNV